MGTKAFEYNRKNENFSVSHWCDFLSLFSISFGFEDILNEYTEKRNVVRQSKCNEKQVNFFSQFTRSSNGETLLGKSFLLNYCNAFKYNVICMEIFTLRFGSACRSRREREARTPNRPLSCFHQVDFQTYLMGKFWMQSSRQCTWQIRRQSLAQRVRTLILCSFFKLDWDGKNSYTWINDAWKAYIRNQWEKCFCSTRNVKRNLNCACSRSSTS